MSNFIPRIKYLLTVLSRRLVWFLPKNKTIAILDEEGADYLIPCLGNTEYFIIKRRRNIYIKYLLMAIFFDRKLKFGDIRYFYYVRILDRLNPVLVITFVDNCHVHWRLDKERMRGKFLTVQNGTHYHNRPNDFPKEFDHLGGHADVISFAELD
jgi:surface carbohydrate biosynthesis protein